MAPARMVPAACSFPGENARSWEALGEARNPEIPVAPGVEHYVLDTSLDEVYFALH